MIRPNSMAVDPPLAREYFCTKSASVPGERSVFNFYKPICACILVFAAATAHAESFLITLQIRGDARCLGQPTKRAAILDGNTLTFPSPRTGPCSGNVNGDGSFAFTCSGVGNQPTLRFSGKISNHHIVGIQDFEINSRAVNLKCGMSFDGSSKEANNPS
jgi:hypothetical protein